MNRIVLDASALLAVLLQERGAEKLSVELLSVAVISAVNLAEVHSKLVLRGAKPHDAWQASISVVREVVPFSAEHARAVGDLSSQTRSLGLALGDRACLALGPPWDPPSTPPTSPGPSSDSPPASTSSVEHPLGRGGLHACADEG